MGDLRVRLSEPCDEKWEDMSSTGCNRFCATCNTKIHDLSHRTVEQTEALLRSGEKICVRAELDRDGSIQTGDAPNGSARRLLVAASATLGLAIASVPAVAEKQQPVGAISGSVPRGLGGKMFVSAISSKGKKYKAKVREDGTFEIRKLPPETYTLRFSVRCWTPAGWKSEYHRWDGAPVVVQENQTVIGDATNRYEEEDGGGCPIYVGMIQLDERQSG